MNRLCFSTVIDAPRESVWSVMLGPDTYRQWTAPFCEGSFYEGSWEKGQRIRFLAPNGDGMSSMIADNRLHEYISIQHLGVIKNGVEDTASEEASRWTPAFENYTFVPVNGGTEVRVEMDTPAEYESYMRDAWPKALAALKSLCESR